MPDHVVAALEDAARDAARADRDHKFRIGHLLVDPQQALARLARDRPGADQHIGMARAALQLDAEALQVVARRQGRQDFDIAAVAGAAVVMDCPGRVDPRPGA